MEGTSKKLRVVYGDFTLGVHGEGFDYIFSYAQGGLESLVKNGYEWLYRCPKPTFWRAPVWYQNPADRRWKDLCRQIPRFGDCCWFWW